MLVLSRKEGQRIVIGQNIVITILETRGDRVRLGLTAPAELPIHREEVFHRIQNEPCEKVVRCKPGQSPYYSECA